MTNISTDDRIKFYDYNQRTSYVLAKSLRQIGYEIADPLGMRLSDPRYDVIGILKPREPLQKSFLKIKYKEDQRALFIGTLWLNNLSRGVTENKKWILEVYGRDNVRELTDLVREFSEPCGVEVDVNLTQEHSALEKFYSDYSD